MNDIADIIAHVFIFTGIAAYLFFEVDRYLYNRRK